MTSFGKYQVLEKVGEGGFGTLYRGFDPLIQRDVAIKTCTSDDQEVRDRFFQEAQIAGNLHHRNITVVYDFGIEAKVPYLVQEYLSGEDLHRKIKRGDELPFGTKLLYLIQIARGLNQAHQSGVVHRDIKPSNIRVLGDGTVKIMDFGIAKLHAMQRTMTQTGETIGTAAYLSPEQIRGEAVDPRADIFSFGVVAYELLTGEQAFQGDNPSTVLYAALSREPAPLASLWPACPPEMQRIVDRCLKKNRDDRYDTCADLLTDLSNLLDSPQPQATNGVIAPPSGRIRQLIADRDLHLRDTLTLENPSLSGVELRPTNADDSSYVPTESKLGDTSSDAGRRRSAIGLLMLLLAVTGLGTGAWWYLKGFRGVWASAPSDRSVPEDRSAPIAFEPANAAAANGEAEPPSETLAARNGFEQGFADSPFIVGSQPAEPTQSAVTGGVDKQSESSLQESVGDLEGQVSANQTSAPVEPVADVTGPGRGTLAESLLTLRQIPGTPRAFLVLDDEVLGWTPLQGIALAPGRYRLEVFSDPSANQAVLTETVELRPGSAHVLSIDLNRTLLQSHERELSGDPSSSDNDPKGSSR